MELDFGDISFSLLGVSLTMKSAIACPLMAVRGRQRTLCWLNFIIHRIRHLDAQGDGGPALRGDW